MCHWCPLWWMCIVFMFELWICVCEICLVMRICHHWVVRYNRNDLCVYVSDRSILLLNLIFLSRTSAGIYGWKSRLKLFSISMALVSSQANHSERYIFRTLSLSMILCSLCWLKCTYDVHNYVRMHCTWNDGSSHINEAVMNRKQNYRGVFRGNETHKRAHTFILHYWHIFVALHPSLSLQWWLTTAIIQSILTDTTVY